MNPKEYKTLLYNTSKVLRKLRLNKDIRQQDVCDGIRLNLSSYSRMENGVVDIKMSQVWKLSELYGITQAQLINMIKNGEVE